MLIFFRKVQCVRLIQLGVESAEQQLTVPFIFNCDAWCLEREVLCHSLGPSCQKCGSGACFFSISVGMCWNQLENMMPKVGALVHLCVCARCRVMDLFFCNLIHM